MRAGADQGHFSFNHVKKLWQFVDAALPEKGADFRNTCVAAGSLFGIGFDVHNHRSEFDASESLVVPAGSFLNEEYWSFRVELDK